MEKTAKIFVAGHRGLVGSAIVRRLRQEGYDNLLLRTHQELDLTDSVAAQRLFSSERPEYVFAAGAKVGGIVANASYPAEFIRENLAIELNVITEAWRKQVRRLLFLGSNCIYPKYAPQPVKEEYLLQGELEPTNRPYALAKIAGVEMCWAFNRQYGTRFVAAMPANIYGPNDKYEQENSHVVPGIIRKIHEAKVNGRPEVVLWGTGEPYREFLYSDDLADACVVVMSLPEPRFEVLLNHPGEPPIFNVGTGKDMKISDLAELARKVVGYRGKVTFDSSRPDGTPRKLLDTSRLRSLGWAPRMRLEEGLRVAYEDFLQQIGSSASRTVRR